MSNDRLTRQLAFLIEADRLKTVLRRTPISDGSRPENSAEHSWHLALAALTLEEYAPAGADPLHAVALVIVHDLIEVDAGEVANLLFEPDVEWPLRGGEPCEDALDVWGFEVDNEEIHLRGGLQMPTLLRDAQRRFR